MLKVTAAAASTLLLSEDEIRAAVKCEQGRDADISQLNKRVGAAIAKACQLPGGRLNTGKPSTPTFLKETLEETLRFDDHKHRHNHGQSMLMLARWPILKVVSVTLDGTALTPDIWDTSTPPVITTPSPDYEIDGYMLRRLGHGCISNWYCTTAVVVYEAGVETVPDDLKLAASIQAKAFWDDQGRRDGLRSMEIPGVISETYQDKPADGSAMLEPEVLELLTAGGFFVHMVS